MNIDKRGGNNKFSFNKNFFKTWSPQMSYILGFIFADGAIIDARKSSRTCYLNITICDCELLHEIKKIMGSLHKIITIPPRQITIKGKSYINSENYRFRIGSKELFQDLINLGVKPRKSLTMILPNIPNMYFNYFLRGYFDGDGCINLYQDKNNTTRLQTILTSGSYVFLDQLRSKLISLLNIEQISILKNSGAYRLRFRKMNSLKILSYMYSNLNNAPYLGRKYLKYIKYLQTQ